ncbi:MAG TPA: hypothetical protein VKZ49_00620 [Polyangiaceae bacterium]|nr:hypothetical protein [Polyangiaceae bacterium]
MRTPTFGVLTTLLYLTTACGDDSAPDAPGSGGSGATGGGSGGTAAAASGGSGGSGAGSSGGTGGSTPASGGSGASGGSSSGCEGEFGPAETILEATGFYIASPSVTGDQLELFYVEEVIGVRQSTVKVLRRESGAEPFGAAETVQELSVCAAYEGQTLDVSGDGLRMYFTCHADELATAPLRRAVRPDRSSPFVIDPEPLGSVGVSIDLSSDELTALSATDGAGAAPRMYTRASATEGFGAGQAIPGIDVGLINPELSGDGLSLLGALPGDDYFYHLAIARRSAITEPFSGLTGEGLPTPPAAISYASPALSTDCRSLYFVRIDASGNFTLHVAKR